MPCAPPVDCRTCRPQSVGVKHVIGCAMVSLRCVEIHAAIYAFICCDSWMARRHRARAMRPPHAVLVPAGAVAGPVGTQPAPGAKSLIAGPIVVRARRRRQRAPGVATARAVFIAAGVDQTITPAPTGLLRSRRAMTPTPPTCGFSAPRSRNAIPAVVRLSPAVSSVRGYWRRW
jgi:hypothetical protein